jgi:hypothetical protein
MGIPPMRCTAIARRTGERCRKWAVPGTTVCETPGHGAYAVSTGKQTERLTLAQLEDAEVRGYALPRTAGRAPGRRALRHGVLDAGQPPAGAGCR